MPATSSSLLLQRSSKATQRVSASAGPTPQSERPTRTRQELANLAKRRAFRDKAIDKYGEPAVAAAFKSFNVALKGEVKFEPLDKRTRRRVKHASQAHQAALSAMEWVDPGRPGYLTQKGEAGIYAEAVHNRIRAHRNYGKAPIGKSEADAAWRATIGDIQHLQHRLTDEVQVEAYLSKKMGHGEWRLPISFEQAIIDHEVYHYHRLPLSNEDKLTFRVEFRELALKTSYIHALGPQFLRRRAPDYLDAKLATLEKSTLAQGAQAIGGLKRLFPREIIREILSMLWAIFQSGLRPKLRQD